MISYITRFYPGRGGVLSFGHVSRDMAKRHMQVLAESWVAGTPRAYAEVLQVYPDGRARILIGYRGTRGSRRRYGPTWLRCSGRKLRDREAWLERK